MTFLLALFDNRVNQNGNKLSAAGDLVEQQISVLEQKFDGKRAFRAHNAAIIIQRAYREFCMGKKWKKVNLPAWRQLISPDHFSTRIMESSSNVSTQNPVMLNRTQGLVHHHQQDTRASASINRAQRHLAVVSCQQHDISKRNSSLESSCHYSSSSPPSSSSDSDGFHSPSFSSVRKQIIITDKNAPKSSPKCCQTTSFTELIDESQKDRQLKRLYRTALNLFNKKPDRGVQFLIDNGFVANDANAVAKFLLTPRGLSRQMIGEFIGGTQSPMNAMTLECFLKELEMGSVELDIALRSFMGLFRIPGESQKIDRILKAFANRYIECNRELVGKEFHSLDTVFVLSYAIIMLQTDLHNRNIRNDHRMKLHQFVRNLREIDGGSDLNPDYLTGIYNRVRDCEMKTSPDHSAQVLQVDRSIFGCRKPNLVVPHRRLVYHCRLYEIDDPTRMKQRSPFIHQREIFLFNDLILITKIRNRKKHRNNDDTYSYRQSYGLVGVRIQSFKKNPYYPYGMKISISLEANKQKTLHFHARSESEQLEFIDDLQECIAESEETESLRIKFEEWERRPIILASTSSSNQGQENGGICISNDQDSGLPAKLSEPPKTIGGDSTTAIDVVNPILSSGVARRLSVNSSDSGLSSKGSVGSSESPSHSSGQLSSATSVSPTARMMIDFDG